MELENWMMDDTIFNPESSIKTDSEEQLTIEKWMLDDRVWNF